MKRKLLSLLLIMAMGVSLLVGCGDSNTGNNSGAGSNSGTNNNVENDQPKDEVKTTTASYNASGVISDTVTCEITYDANLLDIEESEPITNLSARGPVFNHTESNVWFNMSFESEYYSAMLCYENKIANEYEEGTWSELTKVKIGSMEVGTFTRKYSEDLLFQYWLIQFNEGTIKLESHGNEEDLKQVADLLEKSLFKVTVDGKEPNSPGYAYMLYDYVTNEPAYVVAYNPEIFVADENSSEGQEVILNYADASLGYQQMEIRVNEYASGTEYFESKYGRFGSIYAEVDEEGNYILTEGQIGDTTVYLGFGNDKKGHYYGCVFFAEMPDGNVITGHVPSSSARDPLNIEDAFLAIYPVK